MRICERTTLQIKVSEEEEGGGAPGAGAEIPLQPVEETMVRQAVPLVRNEISFSPSQVCFAHDSNW